MQNASILPAKVVSNDEPSDEVTIDVYELDGIRRHIVKGQMYIAPDGTMQRGASAGVILLSYQDEILVVTVLQDSKPAVQYCTVHAYACTNDRAVPGFGIDIDK